MDIAVIINDEERVVAIGKDNQEYTLDKATNKWNKTEGNYDLEDVFDAVIESFGKTRETEIALIEQFLFRGETQKSILEDQED